MSRIREYICKCWILQCWSYYVKINFTRHQHYTDRTQNRTGLSPSTAVSPLLSLVKAANIFPSRAIYAILFIPLKGPWAQKSFPCLLSLKINLSFANFRKKWQLNTGFHFSLFISHFFNFAKQWILNSILFPYPPPGKKNEKWTCSFIFHFQLSEKRDEPNAGEVISFKQWSFVSFPDVDVIQFNSRTRDFATQRLLTPNRWSCLLRWKHPSPLQ